MTDPSNPEAPADDPQAPIPVERDALRITSAIASLTQQEIMARRGTAAAFQQYPQLARVAQTDLQYLIINPVEHACRRARDELVAHLISACGLEQATQIRDEAIALAVQNCGPHPSAEQDASASGTPEIDPDGTMPGGKTVH